MRVLRFRFFGETYLVDEQGRIKANGLKDFSDTWLFLGGTKHHWSNRITVTLKDAFDNPESLNGCLGFDRDHGTVRQWSGRYFGKLPRITHTVITEV